MSSIARAVALSIVRFEGAAPAMAGSVAALIAPPVESAGGVIVTPEGYWAKVKQHCERWGMLLISMRHRPHSGYER